jgi:hypothetical protein
VKTTRTAAVLLLACTSLGCASSGGKPPEVAEIAASAGADHPLASETPLTAAEERSIRDQIVRNWNIPASDKECPIEQREPVELRLYLDIDGTVTKFEPITDVSKDKCLLRTYDGARRAVMISSPLKLPPGKAYPMMTIRFSPAEVLQ